MAAGDSGVFVARHAKHGVSPTLVNGVTHARIEIATTERINPGAAGFMGPAGRMVTNYDVQVTLYGVDQAALTALVAAAKSDCIVGFVAGDGTNQKATIKNVVFTALPSALEIPDNQAGGKIAPFAARGGACWGAGETLPTVLAYAADT